MDLSMFQDDAIVAEWTLSEVEQGEQIDLPLEAGDWSRANEIRAEICLPEGVDDQIYCTLTSGHRTEGMSEDDGYHFNAPSSPPVEATSGGAGGNSDFPPSVSTPGASRPGGGATCPQATSVCHPEAASEISVSSSAGSSTNPE